MIHLGGERINGSVSVLNLNTDDLMCHATCLNDDTDTRLTVEGLKIATQDVDMIRLDLFAVLSLLVVDDRSEVP